jgi:UDP-3-O-[3-hydroxymyristoyl] glucosamine N-acyltransferase
MRLSDLATQLNATLEGSADTEVSSVATLEDARPGQISFLSNPKYVHQLETTQASAVLAGLKVKSQRVPLLKVKDPYYAFAQAIALLHGHRKHPHAGVHPAAHVDESASVGEGTVIYPGAYVGARVRIGRDCILYPNVVIYEDCILGDRVTLHAGCVVGNDGFGYATHAGPDGVPVHHKIAQTGNVVIEDDVELGANCTIQRATLGSTVIARGTKFGDGVTIGHGSKVGAHCLFVAQIGLAGSVTVGHHVVMAGQVGVAGHLKIGDAVNIGAQSGVMEDIDPKSTVVGSPAMPVIHARRVYSLFTQLPDLEKRIKELERKLSDPGDQPQPGDRGDVI